MRSELRTDRNVIVSARSKEMSRLTLQLLFARGGRGKIGMEGTTALGQIWKRARNFKPPGLGFSSVVNKSQMICDRRFYDSVVNSRVNFGQFW